MCPASRLHLAFSPSATFPHSFSVFGLLGLVIISATFPYSHFQFKTVQLTFLSYLSSHLSISAFLPCNIELSPALARAQYCQESGERLTRDSLCPRVIHLIFTITDSSKVVFTMCESSESIFPIGVLTLYFSRSSESMPSRSPGIRIQTPLSRPVRKIFELIIFCYKLLRIVIVIFINIIIVIIIAHD